MNALVWCLLPVAPFIGTSQGSAPNPNHPLDRPYTLRNNRPALLETELDRQTIGTGPLTFIFPRPCFSEVDSSLVCGSERGFSYADTSHSRFLSVSPLTSIGARADKDRVVAFEAGAIATGASGPASFRLDARTYTELHRDGKHPSYDGEFVERQDPKASGSVAYSSFSRFRGDLALDFGWSRFTAGRDAIHWGPGQFANLAFNQSAIPFNQVAWISNIGPVSVVSVYGQLSIPDGSAGDFNQSDESRDIYAHRYEWRASQNLTFGVSEQLVLYQESQPFAVLPIVPLFILKGTGFERHNNGNISLDAAYRIARGIAIYSEFFIDDLQSPGSLFNDYWGNKWAWMGGIRWTRAIGPGRFGTILEYSRVEPWVYTHYFPSTAQTANAGKPLGNPLGPDSQWAIGQLHFSDRLERYYFAFRAEVSWKGRSIGSALDDRIIDESAPKTFLGESNGPHLTETSTLAWTFGRFYLEAACEWGGALRIDSRVSWKY